MAKTGQALKPLLTGERWELHVTCYADCILDKKRNFVENLVKSTPSGYKMCLTKVYPCQHHSVDEYTITYMSKLWIWRWIVWKFTVRCPQLSLPEKCTFICWENNKVPYSSRWSLISSKSVLQEAIRRRHATAPNMYELLYAANNVRHSFQRLALWMKERRPKRAQEQAETFM